MTRRFMEFSEVPTIINAIWFWRFWEFYEVIFVTIQLLTTLAAKFIECLILRCPKTLDTTKCKNGAIRDPHITNSDASFNGISGINKTLISGELWRKGLIF